MRIYYGIDIKGKRNIFATVTGQMSDGTLVYTEIEQNPDGSIKKIGDKPMLLLDSQYIRRLRYGTQTFERI